GQRVLVDRLWPRGVAKEEARLDAWLREAAPSHVLRERFHGRAEKWEEFCRHYGEELDTRPEVVADLLARAARGRLTLLFASRDAERNNAAALATYLRARAAQGVAARRP
ncbi:MAG TPA: DUF488 family protein, partial [Thermoanaerobaculia bacterium]|nr:DUF488 family protein [Thermoanaerobaculia bacterium]